MFYLPLAITFSLCLKFIQGLPEAYYEDGRVKGTTMITRNGKSIEAFLGIPYAKPPIGPLRFKNPERVNGWNGILTVDTDSNQCPQLDDNGAVVGEEDCLYLNVYTPNSFPDYPYPTMVYFHGGDFVRGSGRSTDAGPEYLLDREITLVTVNYRLGVLGFISTGDNAAPGNFGLKDQVLALKWVNNNIIYFGGDPKSVTIFGQDAGGVSTSLHSISDLSNGLFHRYIAQSGSPLSYWGFEDLHKTYKNYAKKLGKSLNCSIQNSYLLIDCLRKKDINSLVDSNNIFGDYARLSGTWMPAQEERGSVGAFLNDDPIFIMLKKRIKKIPAILGTVSDEGLIFTAALRGNNTIYDRICEDPFKFVLYMTKLRGGNTDPEDDARDIYKFFFNDTDTTNKEDFTEKMTAFITDIAFIEPMMQQLSLIRRGDDISPIYYYEFDYRGTFSHTSLTIGTNENIGVTHGDDLIYLFPMNSKIKNVSGDVQFSESDEKIIDLMIDLWTSFAYTGIPISNSTLDSFMWESFDLDKMNNLKIGNDSDPTLSTQPGLHYQSFVFWNMLEAKQFVKFFQAGGLGK